MQGEGELGGIRSSRERFAVANSGSFNKEVFLKSKKTTLVNRFSKRKEEITNVSEKEERKEDEETFM